MGPINYSIQLFTEKKSSVPVGLSRRKGLPLNVSNFRLTADTFYLHNVGVIHKKS